MLFQDFQPLAAIATTPTAARLLQSICPAAALWVPESLADFPDATVYPAPLQSHLESLWASHRSLVFCLSTGAVVRLIAPLLTHKSTDPAVVVVDEAGKFVISLCGGHQGGADRLAQAIAHHLGATPVLTGAANHLQLPGIDVLGVPFGWKRGSGDWTGVSAAIARQEPVQVIQEAGSTLWQDHLPQGHRFHFGFPEHTATVRESEISPSARVWISPIQRQFASDSDLPKVQWHPRVLWVGVGCERGTSRLLIETAIRQACQAAHLALEAIAGIATLDLKADEAGLLDLCQAWNVPLRCYTADNLGAIAVPNPSEIVAAEVGTPSVAEAAALQSATESPLDTGAAELRVTKQIVRLQGEPGAVTVAIAQSATEYTGRPGHLFLVGTGPGQLDQMTPAAQSAVSQADVVIGYQLYLDLIKPLFRPGQLVEAWSITQERQRAQRAIALAQWGLSVAVVSSGDCGIYGMAGLVMELLQSTGWDGQVPGVQVFPGITALQAAASRVGAPLMHDFCAISLSDLLTPWEVIEQRLRAAAAADFVIALYNPRSLQRTEQVQTAREIFLAHRDPDTPVALVRSAYRPDEQITLTSLGELSIEAIDMLTTVLIGNRSTKSHAGWMITPRGYLGKV